MTKQTDINYDKLVEKSLKYVVVEALKLAAEEGLEGENHFYITFKTTHPAVRLSSQLINQYPEEMTIVLQHQFANLMIGATYFEVDLSFGGVPQTLRIAYDAISYFADPYAKFALSFSNMNEHFEFATEETNEPKEAPKASGSATVVSIDDYRKKHA